MAKPSRSNKKQPAFDPSELEDLIFSPAVGKGVGSHLVSRPHLSTVVTSHQPPVVTPDVTTVVNSPDVLLSSSAVRFPAPAPPHPYTDQPDPTTIVTSDPATVVTREKSNTAPESSHHQKLWITERGDLVPQARVKRIRLAQDVINAAEECVYDTLWNAKLIHTDERGADDRETCRIVQAGYDYLVKRSRLSRKTIQRIIAKLLEKDFIAIETRADIYERSATIYRVFSYRAVLARHLEKGRFYVAKMGPGFSYAQPVNRESPTETPDNIDMTTVVRQEVTPMVNMTTVANETTVTVVKMDRSTVVKMSPYLLDTSSLDNTSSSAHQPVREALGAYGPLDDDVVRTLTSACKANAPDCTEDEIVHFIQEKGRHIARKGSRVYNPIGFLVTAVPKCFSGRAWESFRAEQKQALETGAQRDSEEQAALERWRREQEASLSDPSVSEQEKHLIRLCLGLNTG